jgi:hypothetical protein
LRFGEWTCGEGGRAVAAAVLNERFLKVCDSALSASLESLSLLLLLLQLFVDGGSGVGDSVLCASAPLSFGSELSIAIMGAQPGWRPLVGFCDLFY